MNFINAILRRCGNTSQKIKAIEYDNEKLYDRIGYLNKQYDLSDDFGDRDYIQHMIRILEAKMKRNIEAIERLN
jgi:hypothetical protein